MLAERIEIGQRVKRFRLSLPQLQPGEAVSATSRWKVIAQGTTIGHKRIVRVPPTQASSLRVEVLDALGRPEILGASVHSAPEGR
ncbi:MAG: hypothetical protein ACKPEA_01025 [Planctomycetota bacterium]